ncbi:hypothetical protein [Rubellicoccus peritrichatus]|uniref:Uncharacterized protein n=1 Tax=Rubellicoccus peritrichatus TaxID=3080537 RepID=A0AAQ3LAG8_9BACT|nr:hypothetical protein [Puniceicoccus sp. CR14]WOO41667.1 hypothetical protein RZN69_01105 [Puniceicoccus sp. CR14]
MSKNGKYFEIPLNTLASKDQNYVYTNLGYHRCRFGDMTGGAFAGDVDFLWKQKGKKILIHVIEWKIRFQCHDQEGRELGEVYFSVGNIRDRKFWGTEIFSNKLDLNQYVSRQENLVLSDLDFEVKLKSRKDIEDIFLVATYASAKTNGKNYDMPTTYLVSDEEIKWPSKK